MTPNIPVRAPDQIDLFVHNHNLLSRVSWASWGFTAYYAYQGSWFGVVACAAIAAALRVMAHLLCGWVHSWTALQIEKSQ